MFTFTTASLLLTKFYLRLDSTCTILLVDVAVTFLLHPVLEDHSDAENQDEIDTDNAKCGSEDLIQIPIGE